MDPEAISLQLYPSDQLVEIKFIGSERARLWRGDVAERGEVGPDLVRPACGAAQVDSLGAAAIQLEPCQKI